MTVSKCDQTSWQSVFGCTANREHLNESSPPLEIGVLRQEAGGRRQKERGRRKEPEEVFLQI
ncbi:hypothetical protein [Microcoleus sp. B13-B6]|uniref:hypothetical protein n=1 Tax=unclassified Microcoleus TaxID=2642155 RepID=UPI002FD0446D